MTDFDPDEPWGVRLWRWRTEVVHWSQQDLVDRIVNDAYKNKEDRGTRVDTRLISKWENGDVQRPQAVYQRILRRLGAPLPPAQSRTAPSSPWKSPHEAQAGAISSDETDSNDQNDDTEDGDLSVSSKQCSPGNTAPQLFAPYVPSDDELTAAKHRQQEHEMATVGTPAEAYVASAVPLVSSPSCADEFDQRRGDGTPRRHVLMALGAGVAFSPLAQPAGGLRELVLNAAHGSAVLHSAVDRPTIEGRTLDEARQDLYRLATDYVVNSSLRRVLTELVILRDRLYVLLERHGPRPGDARELHLLLGATCVLLASVSHDLAEPGAAMIQTRAALTFAEFAGHAGLITWVHCTRAMIASWWGTADDVLYHAQRARAAGPSGIGVLRLAGLEARALAQRGQHQQAVELLHVTHGQRDKLPTTDSLRGLGEVFTFSAARRHYYNAAAFAHMLDWEAVEREASTVIGLYETPATGQCWPVTMTLSQVYLAQARLNHSGPEGARETLIPVFAIPDEQRIPQTAQALDSLRQQLRSTTCADLPAARDLDEAIRNFRPAADNQERR